MRFSDLAPFDWVMANDGENAFAAEVSGIKENSAALKHDGKTIFVMDCEKALSPLLITEDILIANGFSDDGDQHVNFFFLEEDGVYVRWVYFEEGEPCNYWAISDERNTFNAYIKSLNYVHRLQHFLRFYGLSDFANNFRIA